MNKAIYIILLLLLCGAGNAQEILLPQPAARFLTKFPFRQFSGGVMVVQAKLDDFPDTLNFVLDTGSGGISLDSATCVYLGLKPLPSDTTITGMGGSHKVSFVFNRKLHFPGLTIDKLNFHVNDYDVLTSVYGEKIDGIIGYSFFSRYIAKIDFDSTEIAVYTPGEIAYPEGGTTLRPAFTSLPMQYLHIKDGRKIDYNFYFDTGAGLCFLMSEKFANDSSVLKSRRRPVVTQAEGMGGRLQMRLTVVKLLQLGKYKFHYVPTYLYEDEFNVTSYPFTGGLLGNDIMRRFNMVINYPRREIHILPNSHFNDPFDYAYTGMSLYYIGGSILVEDVVPGSPADKAGIMKGDAVISVGNNFTNNIMQYKTILQSANDRIKMVLQRKGKLLEVVIKPTSIL